jgi:tetratricopeptide (TPR) repeat protein
LSLVLVHIHRMSLLTTTPTPAKLKAFLALVKGDILDPTDPSSSTSPSSSSSSSTSTTTIGALVIRMELAQRGVLLNDMPLILADDGNDNNSSKIILPKLWEAVRTTAGKSILTLEQQQSANLPPPPLLAGSSAIAGRVAELVAKRSQQQQHQQQQQQQQQQSQSFFATIHKDPLYQSALARCHEVQDDRLAGLLRLLLGTMEQQQPDSSDTASSSSCSLAWYQVAQGYYLRAASFQPNSPPMWKKAWDMVLEIQQQQLQQQQQHDWDPTRNNKAAVVVYHVPQPVEASFPLTQLIRVAASKGNSKRVSELSLFLAESYLSHNNSTKTLTTTTTPTSTGTSTNHNNKTSLATLMLQAFVYPYDNSTMASTTMTSSLSSSSSAATKARQVLQECKLEDLVVESLDDHGGGGGDNDSAGATTTKDAMFWYLLLQFRVYLTQQEEQIEEVAQSMFTSLQNRGSGGISGASTTTTTSMDSCRVTAYQQVLLEAVVASSSSLSSNGSSSTMTLHTTAMALQSALLEKQTFATTLPRPLVPPLVATALECIRTYMVRLQDQAKAESLSSSAAVRSKQTKKNTTTKEDWLAGATRAWLQLIQFIHPILRLTQEQSGWWLLQEQQQQPEPSSSGSSSVSRLNRLGAWVSLQNISRSEQQVLAQAVRLLTNAIWMILPIVVDHGESKLLLEQLVHQEEMLQFISSLATCFLYQLEQDKLARESTATTALVQTGMTVEERETIRWTSVRATVSCLAELATSSSNSSAAAAARRRRPLVQEAVAMYKAGSSSSSTKRQAHQAEFGMAYCQCMVAWSGLHSIPWSTCTISEARLLVVKAYDALQQSALDWGRRLDDSLSLSSSLSSSLSMEVILLELANADIIVVSGGVGADVPFFFKSFSGQGGSGRHSHPAAQRFLAVLHALDAIRLSAGSTSSEEISLLQCHCYGGLARVTSHELASGLVDINVEHSSSAEAYASQALQLSDNGWQLMEGAVYTDDMIPNATIWTCPTAASGKQSFRYLLSVARQLVAESLMRSGRLYEAESFLAAAVRDAPMDAEAALALGSFLLQTVLYRNINNNKNNQNAPSTLPTDDETKAAQIQLLKAAKLDSTKANPFALLGVWFESQHDLNRARGCYSKALAMDPPNPVAGRGMLRLAEVLPLEEQPQLGLLQLLDTASNTNSLLNGWAWRAIGRHKEMVESQDELAVVAILKALRCRDIERPLQETLGIFYDMPRSPMGPDHSSVDTGLRRSEKAETLAELAMCYHRLGRYTASIRAFYSAIEAAGEYVASSVLCSCARGASLPLAFYAIVLFCA